METNAHISIGSDSKITKIYKFADNSKIEFLGRIQDQVRTREVHIKLIVNNAPIYSGWKVTNFF